MEPKDRDLLVSMSERLGHVVKTVDQIQEHMVPRTEVEKEVKRLDEKINVRTKAITWLVGIAISAWSAFTAFFGSGSTGS